MRESIKLGLIVLATIGVLMPNIFVLYEQNVIEKDFKQWTIQYAKQFKDQYERAYRFQIFKKNKLRVEQHNKLADAGQSKYYIGLNQFATITLSQYKHQFGNLNNREEKPFNAITTKCTGSIGDSPNPPPSINWTDKYVDPNVKVEGKCAANWAFSAVGAIQGIYSIKQGKFTKLSDQQIIDCSGDYGNEGCGGGFMEQAFWYAIDQGMANQISYPYTGINQPCKYSQSQKIMKIDRCAKVPSKVYEKLLSAIIQQPVSVSVASQNFILYIRGIYDGDCSTDIDRGMLLVGYGTQEQVDYWLIKNSFGPSWGQKGYIRLKKIAQDGPGFCGIQLAASVPQLLE